MDYRDKILDFLGGTLVKEEQLALQQVLAGDSYLQEELRLQQEILYTLNKGDDDVVSFRKQVADIGQEFLKEKQNNQKRKGLPVYAWSSAAAIAIILGLSVAFGWFSPDYHTTDSVYSSYYQPFITDMSVRGDGHQQTDFEKGVGLYAAGNIEDAVRVFTDYQSLNPEVAGFYLGLCFMETGEYEKAVLSFQTIQEEAVFYADHVAWYLALAYLKQGHEREALAILNDITNAAGTYQNKAKEMVKELS